MSWLHSHLSLFQKRALQSSENQTEGVGNRTLILLASLMIKYELLCRSGSQKWKNKPPTEFNARPCEWLLLLLLLLTPTTYFSLDHKRRSHKWNRKKWKRSDSSKLMTPHKTPIFDFHYSKNPRVRT